LLLQHPLQIAAFSQWGVHPNGIRVCASSFLVRARVTLSWFFMGFP
jgi:hypothetical protein